MSHSQSLIHSAYDSAENIATPPDSDLEDETNTQGAGFATVFMGTGGKWWTSTSLSLWMRKLGDPVFSESWSIRETWCIKCTEARSKRTTNRSIQGGESLMSSSSRGLEFSAKPDAVFFMPQDWVRTRFPKETESGKPSREWCSFCFQNCWPSERWKVSSWW